MSRSFWRTLLALAALIALLGLGACGGSDDDESGDTGGTPAQSEDGGESANVTEQLFAGTARDNIARTLKRAARWAAADVCPAATSTTWTRARRPTRTRSGIMNATHRGL
jgi:hypothetical protein